MSSLFRCDTHENIIDILKYGWLWGTGGVYFIDMELADFTLEDYISYLFGTEPLPIDLPVSGLDMTCIKRGGSPMEKLHNLWTIGLQITSGLEFMHEKKQVHRDLKPNNRTLSIFRLRLTSVLYCRKGCLWKIADFGICAEATSRALTTQFSRGTACYRAPELLRDGARFNRKVDIWALGCILYELATGTRAFETDFAIAEYLRGSALEFDLVSDSEFWQHHLHQNFAELLNKESKRRPRATSIRTLFSSYCRIFTYSFAPGLYACRSYPSYSKWKTMVNNHLHQPELLIRLADVYDGNGDHKIAIAILTEMVRRYTLTKGIWKEQSESVKPTDETDNTKEDMAVWWQLGYSLMVNTQYDAAIAVYKATAGRGPSRLSMSMRLAELHMMNGEKDGAIKEYRRAIHEQPANFWLWRNLCEVYIAKGDLDGAMKQCEEAINISPSELSPAMVLSNLYAARGMYTKATRMQAGLFRNGRGDISFNLLELLTGYAKFVTPPDARGNYAIKCFIKRYVHSRPGNLIVVV